MTESVVRRGFVLHARCRRKHVVHAAVNGQVAELHNSKTKMPASGSFGPAKHRTRFVLAPASDVARRVHFLTPRVRLPTPYLIIELIVDCIVGLSAIIDKNWPVNECSKFNQKVRIGTPNLVSLPAMCNAGL